MHPTQLLFLLLFMAVSSGRGQALQPVQSESRVHFTIQNFGITTGGDFGGVEGSIAFDMRHPEHARFDVRIAAATINTGNKTRDGNLRKEYLKVDSFPHITLVSSRIEKTNKSAQGYYFFTGSLTIKDSSRTISFPFRAEKRGSGYRFTGDFEIDRLQFAVGGKSLVLGNVVSITLDITAKPEQ